MLRIEVTRKRRIALRDPVDVLPTTGFGNSIESVSEKAMKGKSISTNVG